MEMNNMSGSPLKIALVGCGKMGLNHVKAITACADATLVAVADPVTDPATVQAAMPAGVRWFRSTAELLDAVHPDVVHIVTPPATHIAVATQCLEHGAHVYVEKPFTLTAADAAAILEVAARGGRKVCAGHQLLFEPVARQLFDALPIIGRVVHVESYFSFKTVRKAKDGRSLMSPVEQLLDILPHPVYTMLAALAAARPGATPEVTGLEVRPEGEVRALVTAGDVAATLIVTLQGRPVDSYLRVVGTNGALRADFVRGALTSLAGAGASFISLLSNPYREAKQIAVGSTRGFAHRILHRKRGYPGLTELSEAFYKSIREGSAPPLSPGSLLDTVRVCERVGVALRAADVERERRAERSLEAHARGLVPADRARGVALVTGGNGMLGTAVVRELRAHAWAVRSVSRRVPACTQRQPGVEYVAADLGGELDPALFAGVSTVVHCAAETAGNIDAHQRNTVEATRNLLLASAGAGVKNFLHVSSIAVLKPGNGRVLTESSPVDTGNLGRGPYVWAKAEAEREVVENGPRLGLTVRVVRPGPLVDFAAFEPPGRLGRELGPVFLAVGPRNGKLSLCDVSTAATVMRVIAADMNAAAPIVNLVEPEAPSRQELLARWLSLRPDLGSLWMPAWVLAVLSPIAIGLQKLLRPKATPLNVAAAFAAEKYDAALAAGLIERAKTMPAPSAELAACSEVA
jgi:predicted dehydrogenase/nucleoside-diphosphate-sugar epimerase